MNSGDSNDSERIFFYQVKLSQKPVITPATLPPNDVDKNHPPIIKAVNRGGASFETNDKPMGLKQYFTDCKDNIS